MNSLKKTLARDDLKKYHKNKIQIHQTTKTTKTKQWNQIQSLLEHKESQNKNLKLFELETYKKILWKFHLNGEIQNIELLSKEMIEKYYQIASHETKAQKSQILKEIILIFEKDVQNEESNVVKKIMEIFISAMQKYIKQVIEKEKKEKEKYLQEYNNLFKILKPMKSPKKLQSKKLFSSTSATNLKIKVTQEEYHIKKQQNSVVRKKSLDNLKNRSKGSSSSNNLNSKGQADATQKLQMFFKEPSVKLVKTKIQYDYSAVFEASKSNIHARNKTTTGEQKVQKQKTSKINKVNKDKGFIFYRPTAKKN